MLAGAVCMSHSPLIDAARTTPDVEARFAAVVDRLQAHLRRMRPELVVVFYPDHVNGFFYRLLPPFCVGIGGESIGDYGSAAGALEVPEEAARSLTEQVLAQGVDTALSYRMQVDHGAVQPLEMLFAGAGVPAFIPVFVNSAMPPRPRFARCRALGEAVGHWAAARPEKIVVIASGGLSHDPPLPSLAGASPEVRARLVDGEALSFRHRFARQDRVAAEGRKQVAGESELLPLNPDWDRRLLSALADGELGVLDDSDDAEITGAAGRGAHEVRTWVAALACLSVAGRYRAEVAFYEPVDAWLTGMGVLTAAPPDTAA